MNLIFPFQPPQQLHDNEGGEKDGFHFGPKVPGCRAALPRGHVRNKEGEGWVQTFYSHYSVTRMDLRRDSAGSRITKMKKQNITATRNSYLRADFHSDNVFCMFDM